MRWPLRSGRHARIAAAAVVAYLALVGGGSALLEVVQRSDVGPDVSPNADRERGAPIGGTTAEGGDDSAALPPSPATGPPSGSVESAPASVLLPGSVLSAPRNGRDTIALDVVTGTSTVSMSTAELGDDLYRVSTADDGGVRTQVRESDGAVDLSVVAVEEEESASVTVTLNSAVRWDLQVRGGVKQMVIDMDGGRLAAVEFDGGAGRVELRLPRPQGTLKVRTTGGVGQLLIRTDSRDPVRVRIGKGAGKVTVADRAREGFAPDTYLTPPNWERTTDRVDVDVVGGVADLVVGEP